MSPRMDMMKDEGKKDISEETNEITDQILPHHEPEVDPSLVYHLPDDFFDRIAYQSPICLKSIYDGTRDKFDKIFYRPNGTSKLIEYIYCGATLTSSIKEARKNNMKSFTFDDFELDISTYPYSTALTKNRFFACVHRYVYELIREGRLDESEIPVSPLASKIVFKGKRYSSVKHLCGPGFYLQAAFDRQENPEAFNFESYLNYFAVAIALDYLSDIHVSNPNKKRRADVITAGSFQGYFQKNFWIDGEMLKALQRNLQDKKFSILLQGLGKEDLETRKSLVVKMMKEIEIV